MGAGMARFVATVWMIVSARDGQSIGLAARAGVAHARQSARTRAHRGTRGVGMSHARCGGRVKEVFFFEKKNQKTFVYWRMLPASLAPNRKSFWLLFFKKEALS
jgi:hypothetical protein